MQVNQLPPNYLIAGTIVTVPIRAWFNLPRHFAVMSNRIGIDGLPIVIANTAESGGAADWLWTDFTQGQPYEKAYYPSNLQPETVLQNAYGLFGRRYDLLTWNCEHFVNACHGLPAVSRQVQGVVLVALVGGVAVLAARAA